VRCLSRSECSPILILAVDILSIKSKAKQSCGQCIAIIAFISIYRLRRRSKSPPRHVIGVRCCHSKVSKLRPYTAMRSGCCVVPQLSMALAFIHSFIHYSIGYRCMPLGSHYGGGRLLQPGFQSFPPLISFIRSFILAVASVIHSFSQSMGTHYQRVRGLQFCYLSTNSRSNRA